MPVSWGNTLIIGSLAAFAMRCKLTRRLSKETQYLCRADKFKTVFTGLGKT
jgi:hypothetical protein